MENEKMNIELDDIDIISKNYSCLFPENSRIENIEKIINLDNSEDEGLDNKSNLDYLYKENKDIFNIQDNKSFLNLFDNKKINFYEKIKQISLQNYDDHFKEIIKNIKDKFNNSYLNKEIIDNYIFMNYNKNITDVNVFNKFHFEYNKLLINIKNSFLNNNFTPDIFIKDILDFMKNSIDRLLNEIINYSNHKIKNDLIKFNEEKSYLSKTSLETQNQKYIKKKWTDKEINIIKKLINKDEIIDSNDIINFCDSFKRSKNSVLSKINKLKKQLKNENEYNNFNKNNLPQNIIYQLIDLKFGNDEYLGNQGIFLSSIKSILKLQNIKFEEINVIKKIELLEKNNLFKLKKVNQFKMSTRYNFKSIYYEEISVKDYIYDLFKNKNEYLYYEMILNKIKINFDFQEYEIKDDLLNFLKSDKNIVNIIDIFIYK